MVQTVRFFLEPYTQAWFDAILDAYYANIVFHNIQLLINCKDHRWNFETSSFICIQVIFNEIDKLFLQWNQVLFKHFTSNCFSDNWGFSKTLNNKLHFLNFSKLHTMSFWRFFFAGTLSLEVALGVWCQEETRKTRENYLR